MNTSHKYDYRLSYLHNFNLNNGETDKRVDFTSDKASQLIGIDRFSDLAGTNLVAESDYTYDQFGRLIDLVHGNNGGQIASYNWVYDQANRITQFTSPDGVATYNYDHRNQLVTADYDYQSDESYSYDGTGNRTNTGYVTGSNNQLLSDGVYNYTYDNEGNRLSRTEIATGEVSDYQWDYRNRLIGVVTSETNPSVDFRFGYTGREFDPETGQYYYRARYYDATVGRFINEDTIGFAGGDTNLYRYTFNSVLNFIDPSGNLSAELTLLKANSRPGSRPNVWFFKYESEKYLEALSVATYWFYLVTEKESREDKKFPTAPVPSVVLGGQLKDNPGKVILRPWGNSRRSREKVEPKLEFQKERGTDLWPFTGHGNIREIIFPVTEDFDKNTSCPTIPVLLPENEPTINPLSSELFPEGVRATAPAFSQRQPEVDEPKPTHPNVLLQVLGGALGRHTYRNPNSFRR